MNRVLVVGSSNTDMVVRVKDIPHPGQTVMGGEFKVFAGGKGANQAVAAIAGGIDKYLVDGVVNLSGWLTKTAATVVGRGSRRASG